MKKTTDNQYQFKLSDPYQKQLNKLLYLSILTIIPITVIMSPIMQMTIENWLITSLISFCFFSLYACMLFFMFRNITLYIDNNGITSSNFLYNNTLKMHFKWQSINDILAIQPKSTDQKIVHFLGLKTEFLDNETLFIPTRSQSIPPLMAFSDKAWVNDNISLGEAISICCDKPVIPMTSDYFHLNYKRFGSKNLDKASERMAYVSVVISLLAIALLFCDDLFTLNYGNIKSYLTNFAVILTLLSAGLLFILNKSKQLESIIATMLVSTFFGVAVSCCSFSVLMLVHQHLAQPSTVEMTLTKAQYQSQNQSKDYDKWENELGHIDCQPSDVPENTKFTLSVHTFMTVTRFDMAEICLDDEKRAEKN